MFLKSNSKCFLSVCLAAVHVIAHLLNVEWYNNSRRGVYDGLSTALSNLEDADDTTYLNPIRTIDIVRHPLVIDPNVHILTSDS